MMFKLILVSILLQSAPEAGFWFDDDPFLCFIWLPALDENEVPWQYGYNVWVSVNGGEWVLNGYAPSEQYTVLAKSGKVYRVKVAAAWGEEQGEYSPESDPVICALPKMLSPRMLNE